MAKIGKERWYDEVVGVDEGEDGGKSDIQDHFKYQEAGFLRVERQPVTPSGKRHLVSQFQWGPSVAAKILIIILIIIIMMIIYNNPHMYEEKEGSCPGDKVEGMNAVCLCL